ncbi:hypothetical protein QL093DRAFT_2516305, partial [Fusarium oxysporum]
AFLLATVLSAASAAVVILTLHGLRLQVYRPIQCSEYRGELCAWPWMKNLYSNAFPLLAIPSYTQLSLSARRRWPWVDRVSRHLALFPPPQFRIYQLGAPPAEALGRDQCDFTTCGPTTCALNFCANLNPPAEYTLRKKNLIIA